MSDYTQTPNYGLLKPIVNADNDVWGDHWNLNADTLDNIIFTIQTTANVKSWNGRTGAVALTNADVIAALPSSASAPIVDGVASAGIAATWSRGDHVHPTDTSRYAASNPAGYQTAAQVTTALALYAPLASPALTGNPTAPTPAPGDADTSIATTAFVQTALGGVPSGAPIGSPAFTGDPTAPTPPAGDNDTSIATTAFVTRLITPTVSAMLGPTSGTYSTPSGAVLLHVRMVGGGGGGGGATAGGNWSGSGGGGGGYTEKWIAAPSPTYSYTVGGGGSASPAVNGGNGGPSTFGGLTAGGGGPGTINGNGGAPGSGSAGDINSIGGSGGAATWGAGNGQAAGGMGGASFLGPGSGGGGPGSNAPYAPGPGGGGGGGGSGTSATQGAAGGQGLIIVVAY